MHTRSNHLTRSLSLFAASLGLASTLALAGCAGASAQVAAAAPNTITVTGTGAVEAVPDVARITLVIQTEGDNATAAQKANGKPTKAVIKCLTDHDVPKEQIQTSYTDLSPLWDEDGNESERYQMRTVLEVEGLPIDGLNELMEACVEAGATEVSGPEYYVSTYDELYEQALKQAVENTQPKAQAIADASKVKLGGIVDVSEGYQDRGLSYDKAPMATEEAADAGGLAEFEAGQVSITAEVSVSYELR